MTRAQTTGMQYVCLFFARGCCPYGWECEYLHTLPDPAKSIPDSSKDCFARDKFADYRDDMGGVGSFNRQNRTLYVGRIKETGNGQETEEVVRRHFKEFGDIERSACLYSLVFLIPRSYQSTPLYAVRVLQYRSVAFVTYVSELHAQFAKESMACQSLDNDEILNVRWATEDPNPVQKVAEKRRLEEMGQEAIAARMDPRIVDAMRAVRALEDGDALDDDGQLLLENGGDTADIDDDTHERGAKRQRIDSEAEEDNDDDASAVPSLPAPPQPKGLLSADTLEGLRYFAEIKARTAPPVAKSAPRPPTTATIDLGGYGSDDD
jgi:hypothetical protein